MLIRGGLAALSKTFGRHIAIRLVLNTERGLTKEYDCAISLETLLPIIILPFGKIIPLFSTSLTLP
jgi:hypothetical protein